MSDPTRQPPCPNPACAQSVVICNGSHRGRARYHCRGCGRYFGETESTPMYHLHTSPAEVAQVLLVVMQRGSLRAAEEITGRAYETISVWLHHAEAVTTLLADDLHLTTVEIDEFWSFVRKKLGRQSSFDQRDSLYSRAEREEAIMSRRTSHELATHHQHLYSAMSHYPQCGQAMWTDYTRRRTVIRLHGVWQLILHVRGCRTPDCPWRGQRYIPEELGGWVLPQSEFGLDIIASIGALRYREQRCVPQIHDALQGRGVAISERAVTNLLHRYDELVALHLADDTYVQQQVETTGVVIAIDGMQPDVGHEVLWVLRDTISGTVLLARSLLSGAEEDVGELLCEVRERLARLLIPVRAVVSDGQHTIGNAVQEQFPEVPHQLCQFHYLREAARPITEAERHAKKELKKLVRGIRPLERKAEAESDDAALVTRAYCSAVRSALTDDGQPPLTAPGIRLRDRLQAITDSLARVAEKGGLTFTLAQVQRIPQKGVAATAALWVPVEVAYRAVHAAAHILANHEQDTAAAVSRRYQHLLAHMEATRTTWGTLEPALQHFLKVTASYTPGLFHCYDDPAIPRTDNALEQFFGCARHMERRATGRKFSSPALVVFGAVRVVSAVATRHHLFAATTLRPSNVAAWYSLRDQVTTRQTARHEQARFRRNPQAYLAVLEARLLKRVLPS